VDAFAEVGAVLVWILGDWDVEGLVSFADVIAEGVEVAVDEIGQHGFESNVVRLVAHLASQGIVKSVCSAVCAEAERCMVVEPAEVLKILDWRVQDDQRHMSVVATSWRFHVQVLRRS